MLHMRFISPSTCFRSIVHRHALKDLEIDGCRVPKDSLLLLNWHVSALGGSRQRHAPF